MRAFLFPGQGAQSSQMAQDIINAYPLAHDLYATSKAICGIDLVHLSDDELCQTRFAQLAIVVHSVACFEKEKGNGLPTNLALAGFSLGEYTALYAAEILDFSSLLRLVDKRAELMQASAKENPGAMFAIIGLDDHVIEQALASFDQVFPVNYNCPGQLVIAGEKISCEKAVSALANLGARRTVQLKVNGAFHTPLMEKAAEKLEVFANTLTWHRPARPLYSNMTAEKLSPASDFAAYLKDHMTHPVRFSSEILALRRDGYDDFLEVGPGKVLSGLIRKIG